MRTLRDEASIGLQLTLEPIARAGGAHGRVPHHHKEPRPVSIAELLLSSQIDGSLAGSAVATARSGYRCESWLDIR